MAKAKLTWTKINLETSDPALKKLWDAEMKAQEATNKHIAALVVASGQAAKPETVRIGRQWGNVSFAIDTEAKGSANAVSLTAKGK